MSKKKYIKVTTPIGRLAWPYLLQPTFKYKSTTEKEYSAKILIDKARKMDELTAAILEAAAEFGEAEWRNPLKDGDKTKSDRENGHWVLTASSKVTENSYPPKVFDVNTKKEITDPSLVYPGCYARLGLSLSPYDVNGYGVKAYLNSALIIPGGEPWGGGSDDLFEGLDMEEIADLALSGEDDDSPF